MTTEQPSRRVRIVLDLEFEIVDEIELRAFAVAPASDGTDFDVRAPELPMFTIGPPLLTAVSEAARTIPGVRFRDAGAMHRIANPDGSYDEFTMPAYPSD